MKTRNYLFNSCKAVVKQLWDIDEAAIDHLYYAGLAIGSIAATNVAGLQQEVRANISRIIPQQRWEMNIAFPFRKN